MTIIGYIQDLVAPDMWCGECEFYYGYSECDECGNSVCGDIKCATSYPHNSNKNEWIICMSCNNRVLEKLKPIHYDENEYENQKLSCDEVSALMTLLTLSAPIN